MTSGSMLPRSARILLPVLARLAVPLWLADGCGGWWAYGDRAQATEIRLALAACVILTGLATVATVSAGVLYITDAISDRTRHRDDLAHEQKMAMLATVRDLACGPGPDGGGETRRPDLTVLPAAS